MTSTLLVSWLQNGKSRSDIFQAKQRADTETRKSETSPTPSSTLLSLSRKSLLTPWRQVYYRVARESVRHRTVGLKSMLFRIIEGTDKAPQWISPHPILKARHCRPLSIPLTTRSTVTKPQPSFHPAGAIPGVGLPPRPARKGSEPFSFIPAMRIEQQSAAARSSRREKPLRMRCGS